jgi:CheY-like chemotaxis protein
MEERLQQAQKMEAVGRLAGGIAHDFNNILTVITGFCDLALETPAGSDSLHMNLLEINRAAKRAVTLTAQLLAFSRKQILQPRILSPNELVENMTNMLHRLLGEDVDLRTLLGGDVWKVKVDQGKMEQVIMNLAINARDAMPEGGSLLLETHNALLDESYVREHPEVKPGEYVLISVSDTGHGIEAGMLERIFEPFFTTKEQGKGTGLGLSMVYGIVKQSDGHIACYSTVGQGTTFKVYLPRTEVDEESPTAVEFQKSEVSAHETILVVEDDDAVRHFTETILKKSGYNVWSARSGVDAVDYSSKSTEPIDVLITDVVMPGMNGREVARRVLVHHPQIRVLFTSGYTTNAIVHHGLLEEGLEFLQKPFSKKELLIRVRALLEHPLYGLGQIALRRCRRWKGRT